MLFTLGQHCIGFDAHGLVLRFGRGHGLVTLHQLAVVQRQLPAQLNPPAGQADFSEMSHDQPGLLEHRAVACTIDRCVADQRGMTPGHRINTDLRATGD
ncbi:hypothetical protein D3C81_1505870 [compost metagenome]